LYIRPQEPKKETLILGKGKSVPLQARGAQRVPGS